MRPWLLIAALNGFIGVAAGAYGHHSLTDMGRELFETGVAYQMWHALALLAVTWLRDRGGPGAKPAHAAGALFTAGIVLFSGSLYYLGLTGSLAFVHAAPLGGVLLMAGWLALGWAGFRGTR